jgi:PEP-CTERM motif
VMRGITFANGGPTSYLYMINPSTGLGALVGPTGFSMDGLASIPTPEPSSLALLSLGTLVTLICCRRCRDGRSELTKRLLNVYCSGTRT